MSMWLSQTSLMKPEMPSWLEEICQRLNENDPNLTILELTHQRIDDRQASFLANSLRENTIVSAVTLSCFAIVDDGAFSLASVLGGSKSIKTLQLRDLRNSREVVTFFREIARNEKLEEFCLRHCQVCAKGAKLLQEMMQAHRKLKEVRFVDSQFIQCSLSQICTGIQQNSSILRLYLVNTEIDDGHGSRCLSVMLKVNNTLEELYLCENQLGNEGIEAIADGLVANQTLKKLDLRSNGIEVEGALAISSVLKKSTSLTTLSLGMNQVGDLGAAALAQGLLHGDCVLRELDLSDNGIGAGGADALADMLVSNTRLQDLNLAFNSIESKGASSIANILDQNITLRRLSLRRNNICNAGAAAFASKLPTMRGLKELVMINNSIDHEGSSELLNGLRNNMELIYLHVGDTKSEHIIKEIFHWIRLNQAGRRIFRDSNLPLSMWPQMLSRLTTDMDVLYHFLSQKPEILEPVQI